VNRCGQSKTLRELPLLRPPRNKTRGGFLFYSINNNNIIMMIKNNNYGFVSLNGFSNPKTFYTIGFRVLCAKDSYGKRSMNYKEEYADEFILSVKR